MTPKPFKSDQPAKNDRIRANAMFFRLVPLIVFLALAALLGRRLLNGDDPSQVPSALIGHPVPTFSLPPLEGTSAKPFLETALKQGRPTLVNVFASWCVPCRNERNVLMQISKDESLRSAGLQIAGLAYKDDPKDSLAFLKAGQPYDLIGVDRSGRVAIDWGVYGVPETFIVRGDGTIDYKLIGELTPDNLESEIRPRIAALRR